MIIKNFFQWLIILEAKNAAEFLFRIILVSPVKSPAVIVIIARLME
jgi:hypothetical protein